MLNSKPSMAPGMVGDDLMETEASMFSGAHLEESEDEEGESGEEESEEEEEDGGSDKAYMIGLGVLLMAVSAGVLYSYGGKKDQK